MRILIFLSIVALGKANEIPVITTDFCKKVNEIQPLSISSYSESSDNTKGDFSIPVSSVIQEQSSRSYVPVFNDGLTSSVTGNGFISSGSYSSAQQQIVQPLSARAGTESASGFSANLLPSSIAHHAVSSTSSPESYVSTSVPAFSLNAAPVQIQDSSFKSDSKTVEIISVEEDTNAVSPKVSPFNGLFSSSTDKNSPTALPQNIFSSNFAEKSDVALASRFLPIKDQNDNNVSKPTVTSSHNTIFSTDSVTTTVKPPINIPSSTSFPILTTPTPSASSTPYTATTPASTTYFPKTSFKAVTSSSYPSPSFKTYTTPLYNNYNSFFSTPSSLNAYSRVFPTSVPVTTPFSKINSPSANFKTVTQAPYAPTTFNSFSTPLSGTYNSIYSTPRPYNTAFSTAAPVTTPVPITVFPKATFQTITPSAYPSTTFKPYSTSLYNRFNSISSTPRPLNTYSRIYSSGVPATTPVPTTAFQNTNFKTVTPSPYLSTTFRPYSTPFLNNYNSIYSTAAPLNTYSKVFSTPLPVASQSSSVSNGASQVVSSFFKPTQYVPSIIKNVSNTYSSSFTTQSPPITTSSSPVSLKQLSSVFSKPYLGEKQYSSYSNIFSTPATIDSTSPSFPVFTSSTPTPSPTPYTVSVTTPAPTTAFPQVNFKTVTTSPYSSTTFKPPSSSSSFPYSYNTIYSTPKTVNTYSNVFSSQVPVVSNGAYSTPVSSKYVSDIFSKPYATDTKSSLYSNAFPSLSTPSPSFPILTSPAPISPTPYFASITTTPSSPIFLKENIKTIASTPYSSTTFKPYSSSVSFPVYSTPKTFNSYSNVFSTQVPVSNEFKFSSASNGILESLNTGKSSAVAASQSFKPNVDLTSRFDPVYTSVSQPIGTYSSTYPKSNTIHGSSFSINAKPVVGQTSYTGKQSVLFPFRNINSGIFNVPIENQNSYYSRNLSPTFKYSENTLYSPPVPISFSSLSSKPELYSVPGQLSYPSVYSSALGQNIGYNSAHDVNSATNFGYTVQQAPLAKEYHTVEEPVVKTWQSVDSWNVKPESHLITHFN